MNAQQTNTNRQPAGFKLGRSRAFRSFFQSSVFNLQSAILTLLLLALAPQAEAAITATGGTVTNYTENGTNFTAHIFTNSVNATLATNITFSSDGSVEYLVVGGGGGGGTRHGGGGGGGGRLTGATNVTAQSYIIIVGEGGIGGPSPAPGGEGDKYGRPGSNSVFGTMTAYGGGGGKTHGANGLADGGCGGGGCGMGDNAAYRTGGTGSQGYNGGNGASDTCGGGGGGAGSIGTNAHTIDGNTAGAGGSGAQSTFASGVADWYAGGGGGGSDATGGTGGQGGGGHGGSNGNGTSLTAGTDGKGGGGGGCRDGGQNVSGARGGSGIVIVRYVIPQILPAIANLAATNITSSSADLRGSLTSTGASDTAVWVYWGPTDGTTNASQWAYTNDFGTGLTNGTYTTNTSATILLSDGTTYYYNFFAQNASGGVWAATSGGSKSFTTLGKPSVTVSAASGIGMGAATLNGTMVSTNGYPSTFFFCWGTNDFGTNSLAPWTVLNCGTATNGQSVSTNLTGLTYGIRYWYYAYASNAAGVVWSAPTNFVTADPNAGAFATGGTVTNYTLNGTNYRAHIFTTVGTSNLTVTVAGSAEVLVVGGGGGGGGTIGGGGGAGGLLYTNGLLLAAGTQAVVVGSGGAGNPANGWGQGSSGSNSSFGASLVAYGGGGGGGWSSNPGLPGGSGGGAGNGGTGGSFTNGQGRVGGNTCGGGGGAGAQGANGSGSQSGKGGDGLAYDLSGVTNWYAGGGGGGGGNGAAAGAGGLGGGGAGSPPNSGVPGTNGTAGTGGGGGGGSWSPGPAGGDGGSGIVIVRYVPGAVALQNLAATSIQATSATLQATLTGSNTTWDVYAYWGPTDGTNNAAAWANTNFVGSYTLTTASTNIAYPASSGIAAGSTCYYTFFATNAATGLWASPSASFGPPSVAVSSATGIGVGTATMNGSLTSANGLATTVSFCYGTNDFGTNSLAPWTVLNCGDKTSGQSVSTNLTGLTYGIRYWYYAYASNAAGVAWSAPTNFVTVVPTIGVAGVPVTSGLVCWYDAGVQVTTNTSGVVQTWNDLSGNTHHATLASGSPTLVPGAVNSLPEVRTRSQNSYFTVAGNMFVKEHWVVGRSANVTWNNYGAFLCSQADKRNSNYLFENGNKGFHSNQYPAGASRNGTVLTPNATCLDPINEYMVLKVIVNDNDTSQCPYYLARSGHSVADLDICEVIGYSATNSSPNENLIGSYLAWKYNISTLYTGYSPPRTIAITNTFATAVGTTSATLQGTLTGTNSYFDVYAYWGPTDGTNNPAAWSSNAWVGGYTLTGAVTSASIAYAAACVQDTGYWYTLCASNAATNIWATPSKTFITGDVTVQATDNTAQFKSPPPHDTGVFTIRRPATCTNVALTVAYTMSGTATTPTHYTLDYPGSVTLAAGSTSAVVTLTPTIDGIGTAILTLTAGNGYPVGAASNDTVTISAFVNPGIYVSTNGTQQSPYDTWEKACTNLQAALDYAAPILGAKIYLAGNQTFSTPGGDPSSLYVWQNATNVTLSGGWQTDAAPPTTPIGGTVLKRLAASGNIRVMKMASLTNCTVESVTFREGRDVARVPNVYKGINGAGVYMSNCWNVTIADCTIAGNTNTGENAAYGEGLGLTGSSAVLTNCMIADNYQASQYSGGVGIYVDASSRLTVLRSFILRNKGNNEGGNGNVGMGFNNAGVLNLIETVVSGNEALNTANSAVYGGGYNSGILTMQNCLVVSNRTYAAGIVDGLYLASGTATLVNCTFVTNGANGIQYAGGAVAMTNCIVWGHANADLVSFPGSPGTMPGVWSSSIGTTPNNDGVQGCVTPATGPRFVDSTYFHLASVVSNYSGGYFTGGTWTTSAVHSALIDAGDTNSPYSREPAPNGSRINLGYDGNTEVASLSQTLAAAPPTVTNLGAITWGHRTALLRGQVLDPGYPNPQAYLRYWQVGSGPTNEISKGEQTGAFSAPATNLTPGATYQYVAVAINASSNVVTEAKTFVMHPASSYLYVATNGDNTAGTNWITAYSDVQTALNLAEPNDTIYLAGQTFAGGISGSVPGHPYNAFLIWQNATNIAIRGGYDAEAGKGGNNPGTRTGLTVLQRTLGNVRVLSVINVTNCTLDQVTIRDGLSPNGSNGYQRQGCGVFLTNCWNVTLSGCIITNNTGPGAQCFGCGLALQVGSVVLTNTTVVGNTGSGDGAGNNGIYGGGIAVQSNSRITAIRSVLAANKTGGSADGGGGFWVESGGYLDLFETRLLANTNSAGSGGAGYNKGTLTMRNCLVVNNRDTGNNCGIYLSAGTSTLVNCTIVTNGANGLQYAGGAVGVTNCIVWGHSVADATNFPAGSIGYSLLAIPNLNGVNGCLTNDPRFMNAVGDYRLAGAYPTSPCINAGTNQTWMTNAVDLAGETRIKDGIVDLGAYEGAYYTLTVISQYGGASPGTETRAHNAALAQYITNSPFTPPGNTTQFVCYSATVVSNDFTLNSATNVTLLLTNNATLTWQWGFRDLAVLTNGATIADGGTNGFGSPLVDSTNSVTLTITNSGTAPLNLSAIVLGGTNASQFSLGAPGVNPVPVGQSTTLAVTCTPTTAFVPIYATVSISNDNTVATSKNPYDIVLTATALSPNIDVRTNGAVLAVSGTNDFGSLKRYTTNVAVLTITNSGTATLNLGGIGIAQDGASVFTLGAPASSTLLPGGITTLAVTCTPTSLGPYVGSIHITNNAVYVGGKNPYDITLLATVRGLLVQQPAGTDRADGATNDFGNLTTGSTAVLTFTVTNNGSAAVALEAITKDGAHADRFTVNGDLPGSLAAGAATNFTVTFAPTSIGVRKAALHFPHNADGLSPFDINLRGRGVGPFAITETTVSGSNLTGEVDSPTGRVYRIMVSRDVTNMVTVLVTTNPPTGHFSFTEENVAGNPAITSRYYMVAEDNGAGVLSTNPAIWALENRPIGSNKWHLMTTPVRYLEAGQNNLTNELGLQIGRGLVGDDNYATTPLLYVWDSNILPAGNWTNFYLSSTGWKVAGGTTPADYTLEPGRPFWVKSMLADTGSAYCVFTGLTATNSAAVQLYTNAWRMIGYPYAQPQCPDAANFAARGGLKGRSADLADNMYVVHNGRAYLLWLNTNGLWYIQNTTNPAPADMRLNNVGAAFYFTRGTSFWWKATQP